MLNDFIEKVVIHEAEGGRTKDRTQQVDIYFNFIGNFVLPLSEDEVEALQSEEARRAEEIAERENLLRNLRRKEIRSVQRSRQKQKLEILKLWQNIKQSLKKADSTTVRELEERRTIARERSRKSAEKRKQRAENDPEYAKYLEERNAEYNRRHTARRKEQMEALRARAEAGDQEAQSQLAERKQYQVRATVKSYRKMREDALNGDPIAKERYEKTLAMRREAYHSKKSEQTA